MSSFNLFLRGLVLLFLVAISAPAFGQDPLEKYVQEGLRNNLALRQKNISLERAVYALKVANSYFLPSVSLSSGYTHGNGGRSIDLPVGNMLNPVYSSLNQLTESQDFPQIENVEQSFFPSHFLDAHVRTAMPIVNTDLHLNKRIVQDQLLLQEFELKVLERELIKEIKVAYYNYLSALEAERIYSSALELVEHNLRVNKSLLENGKGLHATVLRAQSEIEQVKAERLEAQNQVKNGRRYFNFLLNKSLEAPIEASVDLEASIKEVSELQMAPVAGFEKREELQMLRTGERMGQTLVRMKKLNWLPKVNAFIDLGAQAENGDWEGDSRYYLLGLSLDVPLFNGFRNKYETRQALLGLKSYGLKLEESRQQLSMAAEVSQSNLATAWEHFQAAGQRLKASESYFQLIERGYAEGANSLIEFIDARNQLTTAQLQQTIQTYRVLSAMAQYERETSAYPINH